MNSVERGTLDKRLDGARILWRPWGSGEQREGFVREFSPSGAAVRISETKLSIDMGSWWEVRLVRVLEVLEGEAAQ